MKRFQVIALLLIVLISALIFSSCVSVVNFGFRPEYTADSKEYIITHKAWGNVYRIEDVAADSVYICKSGTNSITTTSIGFGIVEKKVLTSKYNLINGMSGRVYKVESKLEEDITIKVEPLSYSDFRLESKIEDAFKLLGAITLECDDEGNSFYSVKFNDKEFSVTTRKTVFEPVGYFFKINDDLLAVIGMEKDGWFKDELRAYIKTGYDVQPADIFMVYMIIDKMIHIEQKYESMQEGISIINVKK